MKLMTQCNEKSFELEIKSTYNRILQEQLENKCFENEKFQAKVTLLEQQLTSFSDDKLSSSAHEYLKNMLMSYEKRFNLKRSRMKN